MTCRRLGTEQEPLALLAAVGFSLPSVQSASVLGTGESAAPRMELGEPVTRADILRDCWAQLKDCSN